MILRLRFTERAARDLEKQYLWYELRRRGLGDEFFASAISAFRSIQTNPSIYPLARPKIRRAPMPRFPFGVFFAVSSDEVVVLAVVHGRRHPRLWPSGRG
ncbi:MAG: type II toxin-antitoxin system RelE/ParE family toxin [Deltaproteobacteria bacterium]|nr:type II toxin-antitoxin system RelE/ParE family toxin [Deltaproteobacteria bacterium]